MNLRIARRGRRVHHERRALPVGRPQRLDEVDQLVLRIARRKAAGDAGRQDIAASRTAATPSACAMVGAARNPLGRLIPLPRDEGRAFGPRELGRDLARQPGLDVERGVVEHRLARRRIGVELAERRRDLDEVGRRRLRPRRRLADPARRRAAGRHQLAIAGASDPDDVGDRPDRRDRGQQPRRSRRRSPRAPHSRRPRRSRPTSPSARPRSPAPSSDSSRRRARPPPSRPLSAGRAPATAWASTRAFSCAISSLSAATSSSSRSSASNDASSGSVFTSSISLLLSMNRFSLRPPTRIDGGGRRAPPSPADRRRADEHELRFQDGAPASPRRRWRSPACRRSAADDAAGSRRSMPAHRRRHRRPSGTSSARQAGRSAAPADRRSPARSRAPRCRAQPADADAGDPSTSLTGVRHRRRSRNDISPRRGRQPDAAFALRSRLAPPRPLRGAVISAASEPARAGLPRRRGRRRACGLHRSRRSGDATRPAARSSSGRSAK